MLVIVGRSGIQELATGLYVHAGQVPGLAHLWLGDLLLGPDNFSVAPRSAMIITGDPSNSNQDATA